MAADIRAYAREFGEEAVRKLVEIMRSEKAPQAAVIMAANALLDRGFGKPPQSLDITANVAAVITKEHARDIIAGRLASIAERIQSNSDPAKLN